MVNSRLATIIMDSGRKLFESEYRDIISDILEDRFSLDPIVIEYKKKELILDSFLFVLDDGSRVLVSEDTLDKLTNLNTNKSELEKFIQESKQNFSKIIEVLNGN